MARRKTTKKRQSKVRKNRLIIPYPALFFLMLCAGVLLAMWSFRAVADDVVVTAEVAASPVTGPAEITDPTDGQHFSTQPITVTGNCPTDGSASYVKLYRNDTFSGVTLCSASKTFSISTSLFPGANKLEADDFNVTDQAGPVSSDITVFYDTAQPAPISQQSSSTPSGSTIAPTSGQAPFIISTEFQYIGYYVGQLSQWKLELSGGQPPYAINVDWGDGKNTLISQKDAGTITIGHRYQKPGNLANHSYIIKISGSDGLGDQTFMQLFVIVNLNGLGPVAAAASLNGPSACSATNIFDSIWCGLQSKNIIKFAWPAYGVTLLMATSFWLGERQEVINLIKHGRLRKRRT